MKTVILILLMALSSSADVDLIVQAHEYYKDGKPTMGWEKSDFVDFWRQTHKGEIIDVLFAGTNPGTEVHPPQFVVIRVTGVSVEQAQNYLSKLNDPSAVEDSDSVLVKERRFHFTRSVVDSAVTQWEVDSTIITMTKQQAQNRLKEYEVAIIKQKIKDYLQR